LHERITQSWLDVDGTVKASNFMIWWRQPSMKTGIVLLSFMLLSTAACDSDSTVATTDPDEDNALALSVMTARGDTLSAPVENEIVEEPAPAETIVQRAPRVAAAAAPMPAPATAIVPREEKKTSTTVASVAPPVIERPAAIERRTIETPKRAPEPLPERIEAPRRTGLIASGSTLSLVTNSSCSAADPGRTFRASVAQSIQGSNGVEIPEGAQAVAEVTSIDKWGAGVGVRVKSVRVDGRSYPVNSRVTYVLPVSGDDGACIKARTRLEVETSEAVRIAN
jgi:hypothetical protein